MTKLRYGGHVGVHNKECNYNSIVIVHQRGGYDVTCNLCPATAIVAKKRK